MTTSRVPEKETERRLRALQAAVDAGYEINRGAVTRAAKALGMARTTLRDWFHENRELVEARITPPEKDDPVAEIEPPAQRTIDDEVVVARAKSEASYARAKLKEAAARIADLEDRLKDLEWAAKASMKPADWTLPDRRRNASEHTPYLLTSDFQIGEVIRPEETEYGRGYNVAIFQERYRELISTTVYLLREHAGPSWNYPGIIYARGGDTISGGIHDELKDTDELTPLEAVEVAFEAEAWGIRKLKEAFGRVEVKDSGGGNHDRITHKPRTKKANAHSYDRLISYMLRREFAKDDRVTFQTTQSPDVYFPIYDMNILLTHGDKIGSRGGQGFVGPAATIMRGAQKVLMEQAALGRHVDRVDIGHFHTPLYLDWVVCNGCLPGYSEFAKSHRMRPSPPQQFLMVHHPKHGVVDIRPIILK